MKTRKRKRVLEILAVVLVFATLAWPAASAATTWTEDPDAGKDVANAQVTSAAGPLDAIFGTVGEPDDVADLFEIRANGATLTAKIVDHTDVFLFLFDAGGSGIAGVDCISGCEISAAVTDGEVYYLGVSATPWFPYNASDPPIALFVDSDFDGIFEVNNADALSGWSSSGSLPLDPPFYIDLTGVNPATQAVPEPASLLLLGSGLLGLGAATWRGRR